MVGHYVRASPTTAASCATALLAPRNEPWLTFAAEVTKSRLSWCVDAHVGKHRDPQRRPHRSRSRCGSPWWAWTATRSPSTACRWTGCTTGARPNPNQHSTARDAHRARHLQGRPAPTGTEPRRATGPLARSRGRRAPPVSRSGRRPPRTSTRRGQFRRLPSSTSGSATTSRRRARTPRRSSTPGPARPTLVVEQDGRVDRRPRCSLGDAWSQSDVADQARHQAELGWVIAPATPVRATRPRRSPSCSGSASRTSACAGSGRSASPTTSRRGG